MTCERTSEEFAYSAMLFSGQYMGCGDAGSGLYDIAIQGTVVGLTTEGAWNVLQVDGSQIRIKAPGLNFWIPPGTFVRVVFAADEFEGNCVLRLLITALDYLQGVPNPTGLHGVLFAAASGTAEAPPEAPFGVQKVYLDCPVDAGGSCGTPMPGNYALRFYPAGDPSSAQASYVYMGQAGNTFTFPNNGTHETLHIRNLQSYLTGQCGETYNWGWWAVPAAPE
jgi:hypothetical protein